MTAVPADTFRQATTGRSGPPTLDLVVPAHNEERYLEACIERLTEVVKDLPFSTTVTIVDSGSSDRTWELAQELAEQWEHVSAIRVAQPGRGRALRRAWERSSATYIGYTDVDLSGDPTAIDGMLERLTTDQADIVIASRLAKGSSVIRSLDREVLSRGYSGILQWMAAPPFLDAQCGLKVLRADRCRPLLDAVRDEAWFFDTELLMLSWGSGLRVEEWPIRWIERRDSRVHVSGTVLGDLQGLARMSLSRLSRARSTAPTVPVSPVAVRRELRAVGRSVTVLALTGRSRDTRNVMTLWRAFCALRIVTAAVRLTSLYAWAPRTPEPVSQDVTVPSG
jgi:NAD(P)-dependent dehydrogenase (short-subunit alcohol dehydrogenase family)